jgi:hypothetical protein
MGDVPPKQLANPLNTSFLCPKSLLSSLFSLLSSLFSLLSKKLIYQFKPYPTSYHLLLKTLAQNSSTLTLLGSKLFISFAKRKIFV